MMHSEMMGGGMMWAMGFVWLPVAVLLILSIAALVKYLFLSKKTQEQSRCITGKGLLS